MRPGHFCVIDPGFRCAFRGVVTPRLGNAGAMKRKLRVFEYICGSAYRAGQVTGSYGTLGFWAETGRYQAVIDAIGDTLIDAVGAAIRGRPAAWSVDDLTRGAITQRVFARLCDPAPDDSRYSRDADRHARIAAPARPVTGGRANHRNSLSWRFRT